MFIMVYPSIQLLKAFKLIEFRRFKWSLNLLQFQQKKIRSLKNEIDTLKSDNQLLTDEITGLHKIWMSYAGAKAPPPFSTNHTSQPKKNAKITDIHPVAQIEYSSGIPISEILTDSADLKSDVEKDQWQETASIDKVPF